MLTPLSETLKQVTSPYHRELDQLTMLKNLLSPTLTAEQYEKAIFYFYHCFSHWQPELDDATKRMAVPPFAQIDTQVSALEEEVRSFKHIVSPNTQVPLPIIPTVEAYLGYSYVLTGAQLGAQFIIKKLQKSTLANSYRFDYYASLSQSAVDITTWKRQLDSLVMQRQCNPEEVIEGAIHCFSQLIGWFGQTKNESDSHRIQYCRS